MSDDDDDENLPNEQFDVGVGLYFTLDVGLDNKRLTQPQREAIRKAMASCLAEMRTKLLIMGLADVTRISAQERSSTNGVRALRVPQEVTREADI